MARVLDWTAHVHQDAFFEFWAVHPEPQTAVPQSFLSLERPGSTRSKPSSFFLSQDRAFFQIPAANPAKKWRRFPGAGRVENTTGALVLRPERGSRTGAPFFSDLPRFSGSPRSGFASSRSALL